MRAKQRFTGQTLIEFALILPALLLLVMGLFDLGRAILYYAVLNTAAREGTRSAIIQTYKDYGESYPYPEATFSISACEGVGNIAYKNICTIINENTFNISELQNSEVNISHRHELDEDNEVANPRVKIRIEYTYQPITPLIRPLIGTIPINIESEMLLTPVAQP